MYVGLVNFLNQPLKIQLCRRYRLCCCYKCQQNPPLTNVLSWLLSTPPHTKHRSLKNTTIRNIQRHYTNVYLSYSSSRILIQIFTKCFSLSVPEKCLSEDWVGKQVQVRQTRDFLNISYDLSFRIYVYSVRNPILYWY